MYVTCKTQKVGSQSKGQNSHIVCDEARVTWGNRYLDQEKNAFIMMEKTRTTQSVVKRAQCFHLVENEEDGVCISYCLYVATLPPTIPTLIALQSYFRTYSGRTCDTPRSIDGTPTQTAAYRQPVKTSPDIRLPGDKRRDRLTALLPSFPYPSSALQQKIYPPASASPQSRSSHGRSAPRAKTHAFQPNARRPINPQPRPGAGIFRLPITSPN
ncbi:hypothetical protein BJ166DRAFT_490969 [Pestalotiopsis sp. NC0098]|nr:hypothetical protein BJ166DRAFT_490969 [Pestalotiopsis sp. NC0098]